MSRRKLGILQIIVSGICFGCLGFFAKMAYAEGFQAFELLCLRFLTGSLFLAFFCFVQFKKDFLNKFSLSQKEFLYCAVLGIGGYAVFSSCFFFALKGLSSSMTVLLLYTYPALVSVGAYIFFGEKISRKKLSALPLALVGLILLIWKDVFVNDPRYLLFGLGSALFYSFYILTSSRWLKGVDPLVSTFYIQLSAGTALLTVLLISNSRPFPEFSSLILRSWIPILGLGLICSAAAMSLFLMGLKKLKNWEVSVLSTTEPLSAVLIALLFLGEKLSILQTLGAFAIFSALVFVSYPEKKAAN